MALPAVLSLPSPVTFDDAWTVSSALAAIPTAGMPVPPSAATVAGVSSPPAHGAVVMPPSALPPTTATTEPASSIIVAGATVGAVVTPPVAAPPTTPTATPTTTPTGAVPTVTPTTMPTGDTPAAAAISVPSQEDATAAIVAPGAVGSTAARFHASAATGGKTVALQPLATAGGGAVGSTMPTAAPQATPTAAPAAAASALAAPGVAGGGIVTPPSLTTTATLTATPTSTVAGTASAMAAAVATEPAAPTAAFVALEEARGAAARARARAASSGQSLAMQRLGRYITAVNGRRVGAKTLEAAASMVSSAATMEDDNDNLQVVVHVSGVSTGGDLGWASIYGQASYVDPDVLRVFGQAHQFCRGRDVLSRVRLGKNAPPARLVGTCHRGGRPSPSPSAVTPIATSAEDEEYLEVFTSPADAILPPPLSIQRLARQVARARSASRSSSSLHDGLPGGAPPTDGAEGGAGSSSTGADGGAGSSDEGDETGVVAALLPFVLESMTKPDPQTPRKSAVAFMTDLFRNRRAPVQLVRATVKAIIIFFAMRFGLAPRNIQEGFSRWWPHQIVADQSGDGEVVAPRWPLGVKVPVRFLPVKYVKDARKAGKVMPAEEPLATGVEDAAADQTRLMEESVIVYLDAIPTSDNHCKHEEAVAALLLLWDNEPKSKRIMEHEVFKADHAALRRKAAPKRKSPSGSAAQAANAGDGSVPTLAPRPPVLAAAAGRPSTVLAVRAAARATAGGAAPDGTPVLFRQLVPAAPGAVEEAPAAASPPVEEPREEPAGDLSTSSPTKRARQDV